MRRRGILLAAALMTCGGLGSWVTRAAAPPKDKAAARAGLFPRSPDESARAARVGPGFEVELFAADPHLASPVAMAFDADGDVYVAEMLDYPIIRTPGIFGPFPEGQVRLLRTDEKGKVVRSSVFATALAAPTSVVPYDGGVLVSAAPDILFLKDTDGDGHADVRRVVLTGFDDSQDLYRLNSLLWGHDG